MKEKDYLFSEETVEFIEENEDKQLNNDIMDAFLKAATDENGKGDTRKTMIALAAVSAAFLKMCAEKSTDEDNMTALGWSEPFSEILRFYCLAMDHPADEEADE
jgi:hypothetical protein